MIKTELKEVVEKRFEKRPVAGWCDMCNKMLREDHEFGYEDGKPKFYYNYFRVTTHHNNWGNDSVESYEYYDICSVECLKKFTEEFWMKHFEVNNTHEMEIETLCRLERH